MVPALLASVIFFASITGVSAQSSAQAEIEALLFQLAKLQQEVANIPSPVQSFCPQLSRSLLRGISGNDVSDLQRFLREQGLLHTNATGFFGPLTEQALKSFQAREGVVAGGSPQTTGWGTAGPKTRAAIAKLCAAKIAPATQTPRIEPAPAPQCPPLPNNPAQDECVGVWQKLLNTQSCHVGWKCVTAQSANATNRDPVINTISGPSTIYVHQLGSWIVGATDPEGGSLEYSVIWGDEGASSILALLAGYETAKFYPSERITHTYTSLGRFSPEITVRDAAGNTAVSTLSINVTTRVASSTQASTTPIVQPGASGSCEYNGALYPEGTVTEGYTIVNLCLPTAGICQNRGAYIPKFKCVFGAWQPFMTNPYPSLPNYGNLVGTRCSGHGSTMQVVVAPNTQLCRGLLCATTQNYAKISISCAYTNWVDWGLFRAGATTTTICANPTPCEYGFGDVGRACAPRQSGACMQAPQGHPLGT